MVDGVSWKNDRQWEIAAWLASHIINMSGKTSKKRVTPDQLLGRNRPKPRTGQDKVLSFEEIVRRQHEIDAKAED